MSIEQLTTKISTVIEQEATARVAEQQELAAQVALVTRILEILRPAVRALGTRPVLARIDTGATSETRASWRGICLTGVPGPLKTVSGHHRAWPDTDTSGVYHGEDVFLVEDGRLVELQYAGTWDQKDGTSDWGTVECAYTVEKFCLLWARADPELLLQTILALIDKTGDRHAKATDAANRHAEKFRALLALVKS